MIRHLYNNCCTLIKCQRTSVVPPVVLPRSTKTKAYPCQALMRHPNLPTWPVWYQRRPSEGQDFHLCHAITKTPHLHWCQLRPHGEPGLFFLPQLDSSKAPLSILSRFVSEETSHYHPVVMRQFFYHHKSRSGGQMRSSNQASLPLPDREVSVEA